jgi:hypothetical protein
MSIINNMKELINKIIYEINDENRVDKHKIVSVVGSGINTRLKLKRIKDGAISNPNLFANINRFYFLDRKLLIQRIREIESCY